MASKKRKARAADGGISGRARARKKPAAVRKRKPATSTSSTSSPRFEPLTSPARGRPTIIFRHSLVDRLCTAIAQCVPISTACRIEGVGRATFYEWKQRGEAGEYPYCDFAADLQRSLAQAEASLVQHLMLSAEDSWRAAAWLLERRFPKRYALRQTVRVEKAPSELTDEELEAELARLGYSRSSPAPETLAEIAEIITSTATTSDP